MEMKFFALSQDEPLRSKLLFRTEQEEQAGPDLRGPESELDKVTKLMTATGLDLKHRPKYGAEIAGAGGEVERFKPRNKVLSKLAHPTSLLIANQTSASGLHDLTTLVVAESQIDALSILRAIQEHIAAHGIDWH